MRSVGLFPQSLAAAAIFTSKIVVTPPPLVPVPAVAEKKLVRNLGSKTEASLATVEGSIEHLTEAAVKYHVALLVELLPFHCLLRSKAAQTVDPDVFIEETLGDRAPSTLGKHYRFLGRYLDFARMVGRSPRPASAGLLWSYLNQLKRDGAKPGAPKAALAAVTWFATRAGLEHQAGDAALQSIAKKWTATTKASLKEAPPYAVDSLDLMEQAVLGESFTEATRSLRWFLRFGIGTNTRFGDRQRSRPSALKLTDQGDAIGRSWGGKTGPRTFACAAASCTAGNEGWLAVGYALFLGNWQLQFERDYLLPTVVARNGVVTGFAPKPASNANYAAAAHLAMLAIGAPQQEFLMRTPHRDKVTLTHVGVHFGASTFALLEQGGWRSKDESMPMKYGRARGALSLRLTKEIFEAVQDGWRPPLGLDAGADVEELLEHPPVPAPIKLKLGIAARRRALRPPAPTTPAATSAAAPGTPPGIDLTLLGFDAELIQEDCGADASERSAPPAVPSPVTTLAVFEPALPAPPPPASARTLGYVRHPLSKCVHILRAGPGGERVTGCVRERPMWRDWPGTPEFLVSLDASAVNLVCKKRGCFKC